MSFSALVWDKEAKNQTTTRLPCSVR
jgi:hypothetical protein